MSAHCARPRHKCSAVAADGKVSSTCLDGGWLQQKITSFVLIGCHIVWCHVLDATQQLFLLALTSHKYLNLIPVTNYIHVLQLPKSSINAFHECKQ